MDRIGIVHMSYSVNASSNALEKARK